MILFPRANVTIVYFFLLIGTFELASLWFVLAYPVYLVVFGAANTAHSAHFGGLIFGCLVCYALLATHLLPRDQFDVVALVRQWNRRRQYRDAVAGGWNPYVPPTPPGAAVAGGVGAGGAGWIGGRPPPPPDPRTGRVMDLRAGISEAIAHSDLPRAAQLFLELKSVDPQQVLSRQAQLDVANQLTNQQLYPQAADAYEGFLRHYPKFEQIEQVELMLGLIYARYLQQYDRAKGFLVKAMSRLHGERELAMARQELVRIEPFTVQAGPAL
jgi:hypothetical protein